jgi:hypothetical protein
MADIFTPFGKLSFVHLFVARPPMDGKGDPRFSTNLIIPAKQQQTQAYRDFSAAIVDCAKDFFGDKVDLKKLRLPLRKGSERDYEGYTEDAVFIAPWSKMKPGVVDRDGNDIIIPDDVWAGQIARLTVRPFGYDNSGNRGIALGLSHVQIAIKDAPRLDGRKSAADTFKTAGDVDMDGLSDAFGITPAAASANNPKKSSSVMDDLLG